MPIFTFVGGPEGPYVVKSQGSVVGDPIGSFKRFGFYEGTKSEVTVTGEYRISGFTSNVRYATRSELTDLAKVQEGLGRPQSTLASCVLLKKSSEWWALSQDERRRIFEEESHHTQIGLEYLPPVARRLHHSRDLGEDFDFVTWFEFDADHEEGFKELLKKLRATKEWQYVTREYEIILQKS